MSPGQQGGESAAPCSAVMFAGEPDASAKTIKEEASGNQARTYMNNNTRSPNSNSAPRHAGCGCWATISPTSCASKSPSPPVHPRSRNGARLKWSTQGAAKCSFAPSTAPSCTFPRKPMNWGTWESRGERRLFGAGSRRRGSRRAVSGAFNGPSAGRVGRSHTEPMLTSGLAISNSRLSARSPQETEIPWTWPGVAKSRRATPVH